VVNTRLKQDVIPGRTNTRWINFTKEGKYDISCAEICGMMHSKMRNFIVVESQEKYDAFIKELYKKHSSIQ
jgi:cytochrome c oxidase subunit 2